jgi:uncharacterized protein
MLDGHVLVDAHLHPARLPTLKLDWRAWVGGFGTDEQVAALYDSEGTLQPQRFSEMLDEEGVDFALAFSEYSPRVTGVQPIDDLLPLAKHDPGRIRLVANVNPHLHYPLVRELERQLELGAVALKLHPVHAGFAVNDRELYRLYEQCAGRHLPVIVHCGTSVFPGASNAFADPIRLDDVLRDFPELTVVLAHGGRGWWYDAAAFLALSRPNVWIELSGLPPRRLPEYYARHDFGRLCRRFIFATDWPAVPGIARNARAVAALCPDDETRELVLGGNALRVYSLAEAP